MSHFDPPADQPSRARPRACGQVNPANGDRCVLYAPHDGDHHGQRGDWPGYDGSGVVPPYITDRLEER